MEFNGNICLPKHDNKYHSRGRGTINIKINYTTENNKIKFFDHQICFCLLKLNQNDSNLVFENPN